MDPHVNTSNGCRLQVLYANHFLIKLSLKKKVQVVSDQPRHAGSQPLRREPIYAGSQQRKTPNQWVTSLG